MEWYLVISIAIILVLLRTPIYISMLFPSILYVYIHGFPILVVAQTATRTLFSFTIVAVPLFIFVGSLMEKGGMADKIFDFTMVIMGRFKGGLAYVNIFASLVFSGISGSALADIGGIGRIMISAMDDDGYNKDYASSLTCASSTVGPIFPPSIPMILFGVIAGVPALSLLIAGIGPAILIVGLLFLTTYIMTKIKDFPNANQQEVHSETFSVFIRALPALISPIILVGGMLLGTFTPTEVSAFTVLYIVVINFTVYDEKEMGYIWESAIDTVGITSKVLLILAAAGLFTWVLTMEGITRIAGLYLSGIDNPIVLMFVINLLILLLGMFLEPLSAMVLSVPIFIPPLIDAGFDPIHIGVVIVLNLMLGLLTPPIGLSLFAASDIAGVPVLDIVVELKYYYVALLLGLTLTILFPSISLFLVK